MTNAYQTPYWYQGTTAASTYDAWATSTAGTWTNTMGSHYDSGTTSSGTYYQPQTYVVREFDHIPPSPPPTPEQIRRMAEEERARIDRLHEAKTAKRKARVLLLNNLDALNKWRVLKGEKQIEIESKLLKGITYKIPFSGRVLACRGEKIVSEMCISVDGESMPTDDIVLTKLFHLLHDEKNAVMIANHSNQKEDLKRMVS